MTNGPSSVLTAANAMLNDTSVDLTSTDINSTFWNAVESDGARRLSQDLIGSDSGIPEPSNFLACGLFLLLPCLGRMRRRKTAA